MFQFYCVFVLLLQLLGVTMGCFLIKDIKMEQKAQEPPAIYVIANPY
jgi:hypothetical protein